MSLREPGAPTTSLSQPMTRREAREREDARLAAEAKAMYRAAAQPQLAQPEAAQWQPAQPQLAQSQPAQWQPVQPQPAQSRRAQPTVKAVAPLPKPKSRPKTKALGGSRLLSLGAMLFAGALLVAVSVPANAFMSDASAYTPPGSTEALHGQTLAVSSDAALPSSARDNFSVISYAEQLRIKYGRAGTFTATTGAVRWPFPYSVPTTDGFGPRDINISGIAFHNGVDFTPGDGSPIYAIADGVVSLHVEEYGGLGNHVIISHVINGQNIDSVYGHMQSGSSPLVVGDAVKVGDFIGLVGDTGTSYGSHLHFELHVEKVPVDPFAWLTANAVN